jgi:alpha-L-fucosidase
VIDVRDVVAKYAPHAMILQSTLATLRWVGNERGYAPYPAWNGLKKQDAVMGIATTAQSDPDGDVWLPLEVDVPLRNHFWWWIPLTELTIRSVTQLMEIYYRSVGHGAVLLMNNSPNRSGRIPEKDMIRTAEFGNEIKKRFGTPLAQTSGTGNEILLNNPIPLKFDHLIVMEEIANGEHVREYRLDALIDGKWIEIVQGSSIGHKKIDFFKPITASVIRFRVVQSVGIPIIKMLAIYNVGVTPQFQREMTSVYNPFKINSWKDLPQSKWKIFKFPITQFCREATQYEMEIRPEGTHQPSEIVQIKSVKLYHENVETPLYLTPTNDPFKFHLNITGFEQKWWISIEMRKIIGNKVSGQIYLNKCTN